MMCADWLRVDRQNFVNFDPLLVIPTLLFIAGKVEEWPCKVEKILRATKSYCIFLIIDMHCSDKILFSD
jgi:hypothetical protein